MLIPLGVLPAAPLSLLRRLLHGLVGDVAIPESPAEYAALDSRITTIEASVKHLEAVLEGLQDAVHRRSRLDDRRNDDLLRRTERGPGDGDPGDDTAVRRP